MIKGRVNRPLIFMTPSNMSSLVQFNSMTFGYNDGPAVLTEIDAVVPKGKVTVIIGASGGGKTTMLRLIGGIAQARSGQVVFDGQDVAALDRDGLYAMRRRMGMLFQFGALFTDQSVFDNVAFPLREHTQLSEELIRDVVLMKLHAVGLRGARDLMPSQLSGGMSRRVALARAIALDPELIMYDEPFSGLDPISMGTAARLIRQLNDTLGLTSLLVSHELETTFSLADHIIVLSNGRVALQGTAEEVRNSDNPLIQQYVTASPDGPVRFHYPGPSVAEDYGLTPHNGAQP
jgi:phospholipid/cholesterol/gamma-HCH transport system ATP-binding protein